MDISLLGQFQAYLLLKGEKYKNTFMVTDANDCPNLLSHDATFRMGVLKPNYPRSMLVDCGEVPHYVKMSNSNRNEAHLVQSNMFQILKDLRQEQSMINEISKSKDPVQSISFRTTTPFKSSKQPDLIMSACNQGNQENSASLGIQAFPVKTAAPSVSRTPTEHVRQARRLVLRSGESAQMSNVLQPLNGQPVVTGFPLTKQKILSHYSGCFKGIGQVPSDPYKFHLKPDHRPVRNAPRKIPVCLDQPFKEEIKSLVEQGILEPVTDYTDWVNSYVIVEKDAHMNSGNAHAPNHNMKKKLRICLDPRDLNEALEREPYHTCSVDEIIVKLKGFTVFTIVDFKKGYWMVVLHPVSRKLTCMALPFGRFQWTRLPIGTVVAQDIFQSKVDAIFLGMEGVTGIADDMIIGGRDEMEHDRNFLAFMEKCKSNNLTLNAEKIQFKQSQVSFFGHCWTKYSIS